MFNYYGGFGQPAYPQAMPDALDQLKQYPAGCVGKFAANAATPGVDNRIWVASENSAESYIVPPNGFVRLWDSTKPRFYERRADAQGRPYPMDVYEYTRVSTFPEAQATLRDSETTDMAETIRALEARISALETGTKCGGESE